MIAVIGATGNTGRALVKELTALGQTPVSVVRNADKAREVLGPNAKVALAELNDPAALEKALQGVTSVFVVTGHNPGMTEQQVNVQRAAEKAGVQYLVRVSGGRAVVGPDVESVVGRGHHAIEEELKKSKLKWTILRPGLFMQNVLGAAASVKTEGKMRVLYPIPADQKVALTDVRDTAALGARILVDPARHAGKSYEFTGTTTTHAEFAKALGEVLGKEVSYVALTPQEAEATMKGRNMPDWLITHLLSVGKTAAKGGFDNESTAPIRDIVGRAPITTKQFAQDFKGAFS